LATIRVVDADHADAVQRLRCPCCSGRLLLQDREEIYVGPPTLSHEELHPRRGRPRRIPSASWASRRPRVSPPCCQLMGAAQSADRAFG